MHCIAVSIYILNSRSKKKTVITKLFCEDFETKSINFTADGQTSSDGKWKCVYKSNGVATSADGTFYIKPEFVSGQTRAVNVQTTAQYGNFEVDFWMKTDSQNRGTLGANWEVGWFMWHYTDKVHHYFLQLQKNGQVEIGRKDYSTIIEQEIYLYTSGAGKVANPIGTWHNYNLTVTKIATGSQRIILKIDGIQICDITDNGTIGSDSNKNYARPDPPSTQIENGKFGLYCEDAAVRYDNIVVKVLP